jgi:hypothetical protein
MPPARAFRSSSNVAVTSGSEEEPDDREHVVTRIALRDAAMSSASVLPGTWRSTRCIPATSEARQRGQDQVGKLEWFLE